MISNMMMVFIVLVSLSSIIRLIDELRKIKEQSHSFYWIIIYIFLSIPKDLELFLPIVTLLGGLLSLGILETYNECIIMQVFGISRLKIAISVIKASIPILLCSVISSEWVLPYSDRILCNYKCSIQRDIEMVPKKLENFLWFVDNNCFICIERILTCSDLSEITLYYFDKDKQLKQIFFIDRALFIDNVWNLLNVNKLDFSAEACVTNTKISHIKWNTVLTPYMLSILIKHPTVLSISKLYCCMKHLDKVGQSFRYHQLIFWNKILSPFFGFVMVITALSCTFGPLYRNQINIRLFFGVITGFIFYILNQIFGMLSIIYMISPVVGSVLSTVIFLIINIIVIWKYHYVH